MSNNKLHGGCTLQSVGVGFKTRPAAKPRRGTAHVDSDRSLNCAGVVAKDSCKGVPLGVNYVNCQLYCQWINSLTSPVCWVCRSTTRSLTHTNTASGFLRNGIEVLLDLLTLVVSQSNKKAQGPKMCYFQTTQSFLLPDITSGFWRLFGPLCAPFTGGTPPVGTPCPW